MLRQDITGKDSRYKFFWVGINQGTSGVGVLLAEKWVDKVYDIKRVSDRIMLIKLLVGEAVLTVLSVYAPQTGLEESTKDAFYDSLFILKIERWRKVTVLNEILMKGLAS